MFSSPYNNVVNGNSEHRFSTTLSIRFEWDWQTYSLQAFPSCKRSTPLSLIVIVIKHLYSAT